MSDEIKNKPEESDLILNVMSIIVLAIGIYLVFIAPIFYDITVTRLVMLKSKPLPAVMAAGPLSRLYITALYSGIEIAVGFALIIVAFMIFTYKKWAIPMAMFLLSIPAMFNGYIGLGWLENIQEFPPSYITFFLTLLAFWAMLWLKNGSKRQKWSRFGIFTLLGMIGAQGVMLFPHALRVILKNPYDSLVNPANAVLRRTGGLMFLSFVFAGLAILKLAQRKEAGYYLSLLTGLTMAIGAFPAHYARPLVSSLLPAAYPGEATIFTSTYWMAGAQGVILVVWILALLLLKPNLHVDEMKGETPF